MSEIGKLLEVSSTDFSRLFCHRSWLNGDATGRSDIKPLSVAPSRSRWKNRISSDLTLL